MAVAAAVVAYACSDGLTGPDSDRTGVPGLSPTVQGLPSIAFAPCGQPGVVSLLGNDGSVLGSLTVSNDRSQVSVVIESTGEWELDVTHVVLAGSVADIPTSPSGLPQVGLYPYGGEHPPGTTRAALTVPLADVGIGVGDPMVVSAQARLIDRNDPTTLEDDVVVGVWAEGTPLTTRPRGNPGTWFHYPVQACGVAQTVGPEGGTVVITGGAPFVRAELIVPPGALDEPVEITVEAIPLSAVPLPPSGFPRLEDLVAGTAYDFGPDGQTFLVPVQLVIEYDETALAGRSEGDLTLLRINGGVDPIPDAVVDENANRITALVDHFTVYVAAIQGGWSAQIEESVAVSDEVTIRVRSGADVGVQESVGVSDEVSINVLSTLRPDIAETVGVADAVSINVLAPTRSNVAETVGVADAVSINVFTSVRSEVMETVGVTEDVSITVVPTQGPVDNFVYVALQGDNAVAVIDPVTNTLVTTIAVGTFPYAVAAHPTLPEVYVTNRGDGSVSVIDAETQSVVATISNVVSDPIDIAVTGDGSTAYVVDNDTGLLGVIDLATRTVGTPITGTTRLARSIVLDFPGTTAYVAGVDSLVVFDLASGAADTIPGTFSPGDMAMSLDGLDVWMTDTGDDEVLVFDRATTAFEATIPGLSAPEGIALESLTAWVAAGSASIIPVDIPSRIPGTAVALPFEADWIALRGSGTNTAYVSEGRGGTRLSVVDLATGTVVTTLTVGSSPAHIAVTQW